MNQIVNVQYPDPTNLEAAFLIINTDSEIVRLFITYDQAKDMSAELSGTQGTELHHSRGVLNVDATLAAEIFAALVEIIVEVEIGEDLAIFDLADQPMYAMN